MLFFYYLCLLKLKRTQLRGRNIDKMLGQSSMTNYNKNPHFERTTRALSFGRAWRMT